jgi:hypothetical protein
MGIICFRMGNIIVFYVKITNAKVCNICKSDTYLPKYDCASIFTQTAEGIILSNSS